MKRNANSGETRTDEGERDVGIFHGGWAGAGREDVLLCPAGIEHYERSRQAKDLSHLRNNLLLNPMHESIINNA